MRFFLSTVLHNVRVSAVLDCTYDERLYTFHDCNIIINRINNINDRVQFDITKVQYCKEIKREPIADIKGSVPTVKKYTPTHRLFSWKKIAAYLKIRYCARLARVNTCFFSKIETPGLRVDVLYDVQYTASDFSQICTYV